MDKSVAAEELFEKENNWDFQVPMDQDDECLEEMRNIVKGYLRSELEDKVTNTNKEELHRQFDKLRSQLEDPLLKEYSSFEFMEKLYMQEYLVDD